MLFRSGASGSNAEQMQNDKLTKLCAKLDVQVLLRLEDSRLDDRWPQLIRVTASSHHTRARLLCRVNDAAAIAAFLRNSGFEVSTSLDLDRAGMVAAIQSHTRTLAKRQCVGLFYFAGHGVQLGWRNYLLPVDCAIERLADLPKTGVDLALLVDGLRGAANPMNVIVLDACRDNPFAGELREVQKGLSQMDAPPRTFLAYATSPGNTASDGEGTAGAYTEALLKEMAIPGTKIEDVFKRVRLAVRRKTLGAQIPWESTSLEDDFYFIPPSNLALPTESQKEKDFLEQLASWESVKLSATPDPLLDFLRRYPSGYYSELAQLQLDRVLAKLGEKRIEAAPAEGNPFTKGSARLDTAYKVGDSYTYRRMDPESRSAMTTYTNIITEVDGNRVVYDRGLVTDLLGNTQRMADGRTFTDHQNVPAEFEIGRQWLSRYWMEHKSGAKTFVESTLRVESRETITVPAGTYNAFLVTGKGYTTFPNGDIGEGYSRVWWEPRAVRRMIAREEVRTVTRTRRRDPAQPQRSRRREPAPIVVSSTSERHELVAFHQT